MKRAILVVLACCCLPLAAADRPKVLCLLAEGFNNGEFCQSVYPLIAAGYAVDVASPEGGTVFVRGDKTPDKRGRDVTGAIKLADVDPAAYAGLVIPGGFSPGNLEKHERSLEICQAFMAADKPVAGVCHGPRLLMRAGLLKDRVATCLYGVANELADEWKAGAIGAYVQGGVVVDRNLVTARYPGDMKGFTRAFLAQLPDVEPSTRHKQGTMLMICPDVTDGHGRWAIGDAPAILGMKVLKGDSAKALAKIAEEKTPIDAVFILDGEKSQAVRADAAAQALLEPLAAKTVVAPAVEHWSALLPAIGQLVAAKGVVLEPGPSPPVAALIAVETGYDENAAAVLRTILAARNQGAVVVVAHEQGWVRGMNGGAIEATATYAEEIPGLVEAPVVVAPGGLWPTEAAARQAEQLEWVEEQGKRDAIRLAWLMTRYDAGATLVTVGFDSLRVGRQERFKGMKFAAPDQCVWSFGKAGGRYGGEPVMDSAERLISAKPTALPQLLTKLAQPATE
jgi:protease I